GLRVRCSSTRVSLSSFVSRLTRQSRSCAVKVNCDSAMMVILLSVENTLAAQGLAIRTGKRYDPLSIPRSVNHSWKRMCQVPKGMAVPGFEGTAVAAVCVNVKLRGYFGCDQRVVEIDGCFGVGGVVQTGAGEERRSSVLGRRDVHRPPAGIDQSSKIGPA